MQTFLFSYSWQQLSDKKNATALQTYASKLVLKHKNYNWNKKSNTNNIIYNINKYSSQSEALLSLGLVILLM